MSNLWVVAIALAFYGIGWWNGRAGAWRALRKAARQEPEVLHAWIGKEGRVTFGSMRRPTPEEVEKYGSHRKH